MWCTLNHLRSLPPLLSTYTFEPNISKSLTPFPTLYDISCYRYHALLQPDDSCFKSVSNIFYRRENVRLCSVQNIWSAIVGSTAAWKILTLGSYGSWSLAAEVWLPKYEQAVGQCSNFGHSNIGTIAIVPMFEWPKFEHCPTACSYFGSQTSAAKLQLP